MEILFKVPLVLTVMSVSLMSCQNISPLDQAELNTPGRDFNERGAFGCSCEIVSQLEGGRLGGGDSLSGSSGGC